VREDNIPFGGKAGIQIVTEKGGFQIARKFANVGGEPFWNGHMVEEFVHVFLIGRSAFFGVFNV